jgi:hypothetical protein
MKDDEHAIESYQKAVVSDSNMTTSVEALSKLKGKNDE